MKWIVAGAFAAVLMAAALIYGSAKAYLSGDSFHRLVEHEAGRAFGGEVDLSPLRWQGSEVFGESLRVIRGEGSPMDARHLRAEWNWRALFSGAWRLEEVSAELLKGNFGATTAAANHVSHSKAPWFAALLPKRFEIGTVKIQRAELDFGDIALLGPSLEFRQEFGEWKISGDGGELQVPGLPALDVLSFRGRISEAGLTIDGSSLRTGAAGNITATGSWPGKIDLECRGISLADLIETRWRSFVSGTVSANAVVDSTGAAGKFRIEDARIRGAPWMDTVATLTGVREFQNLVFTQADGDFEKRDDVWRLTNLVLKSEGLLRIEGNVEVLPERKLSGELQVGVAGRVLRGMPGADVLVFTNERDGYFWAPVVLGGTLDAPSEDLSGRLAVAAKEAVIESVRPALEAVPGRARDAVGETINTLFDILGR